MTLRLCSRSKYHKCVQTKKVSRRGRKGLGQRVCYLEFVICNLVSRRGRKDLAQRVCYLGFVIWDL